MAPCAVLVASLARPTVSFKTKYVEELTKSVVRSVRNLLMCEGYRFDLKNEKVSIDHIVDLFVPLSDGEAVKAIKYLTAVYLPRLVGDVEPERPGFLSETATLFSGTYGKFIANRFRGRGSGVDSVRHAKKDSEHGLSKRQLSLAMSILQLKRYLPALPATLKQEAMEGCKKRLTTPGTTPPRLLDELARTAAELFPLGWDSKSSVPSFSVTNKSCYERTRGEGGAQDFMFTLKGKHDQVTESCLSEARRWASDVLDKSQYPPLPEHPHMMTEREYIDYAVRSQPKVLRAKMEIVEDPLKARVITKNNWQCTVLKPLQKLIHGRLRKMRPFRLIGEPLTEEIIACLERFKGSKYVSGDYEAATDNFHSDATEVVLETILGNMTGELAKNPEYMILAKRSLTGLTISGKGIEDFVMERGQLMGSLLSFPILCIVNFAVWRHSSELYFGRRFDGQGMGGKEDHVLINGDDIGFCATPEQYELWTSLTPKVGLKPSLGKNYFADEFITLNTQLYTWDSVKNKLVLVPFLNQGLLKPPGDGETLIMNLESLGSMHDDFVKGSNDREAGSACFVSHHKDLLKLTWRNLFGPREYGGLGAHPVPESKRWNSTEGYSVRQLIIAKLLSDKKAAMPAAGVTSRFEQYQALYLKKRFPDVLEFPADKLPELPIGKEWLNVTELVADASISFRAMASWISPYYSAERPVWKGLNKLYQMASARLVSHSKVQMELSDYLTDQLKKELYQLVGEDVFPSETLEECFDDCCVW